MTAKPPDFIDVADLVPDRAGSEHRPEDATWPESSTLPQRAFKLILDAGIEYYGQSGQQAAIRRALPFLEANELTIVETLVSDQPLHVVHGFPKRTAKMPVVAIILGKEDTAPGEKLIGDYAASGIDTYGDAGGGNIDTFSVGFDTVQRLIVYADNPDVTIFWYELVKFILIQAREILATLGIDIPQIHGLDIQIASKDEAELLYMREIRLHFRTRQVFAQERSLITFLNSFIQNAFTAQRALITGVTDVAQMGAQEPPAPTPEPEPLPGVLDDWESRPRAAAGNAPADGAVGIRQTADGPAPYIYLADVREWVRAYWAGLAGVVTLLAVAEGNKDPDLESPAFSKTEANGGTVDPVGGYLEFNHTVAGSEVYLSIDPDSDAAPVFWSGYVHVTDGAFTGATILERACHIFFVVDGNDRRAGYVNFAHEGDGLSTLVNASDVPYGGTIGTNTRRSLTGSPKWVEVYVSGDDDGDVELYIDHVLVQRVSFGLFQLTVGRRVRFGDNSTGSSRAFRVRQVTTAQLDEV